MKDEEIISKIKRGDESALDFLYRKNYRMMVKMIIKNNGSEEEAKDVYQEALIVFWQKAQTEEFVLTSKISTYLYSICQNLWRKELERKSRHSYEESDVVEYMDQDAKERAQIIQKCLLELGETCKK